MPNQTEYEVVAAVSPRSIGGVSPFDTPASITKDNAPDFRSTPDDIDAAVKELTKLGFTVLSQGNATLSIGGSRKLFQDVFGAKLRKQKQDSHDGQTVEFYEVADDKPTQPLEMSGELSDLIEGVALAEPPEYFESALPPVLDPHPDAYRYCQVPNELASLLRATRVHRTGTTGRNVVVAMIDTGFYRHPFFNTNGYRILPTLLGPGASDPADDMNGHGTGESANIFAAAPDIQFRAIKGGGDPVGSFNVAMASTPTPQIITNSWGYDIDRPGAMLTPYQQLLATTIADAVASGIVVCFSAGNGHRAFPASHPDVIAVGGVHVNYPDLEFEASSYASSFASVLYPGRQVPDVCGFTGNSVVINGSNLAPSLMLPVQPGSNLDNIAPSTGSKTDGWGLFSGTSAACPQVAGVAALLLERDSALEPSKVKDLLMKSARDVKTGTTSTGDSAGLGPDSATGAGLVDAKWAWIIAMGDVAAHAFDALTIAQPQDAAINGSVNGNGSSPEFSSELMADLMDTLRSR